MTDADPNDPAPGPEAATQQQAATQPEASTDAEPAASAETRAKVPSAARRRTRKAAAEAPKAPDQLSSADRAEKIGNPEAPASLDADSAPSGPPEVKPPSRRKKRDPSPAPEAEAKPTRRRRQSAPEDEATDTNSAKPAASKKRASAASSGATAAPKRPARRRSKASEQAESETEPLPAVGSDPPSIDREPAAVASTKVDSNDYQPPGPEELLTEPVTVGPVSPVSPATLDQGQSPLRRWALIAGITIGTIGVGFLLAVIIFGGDADDPKPSPPANLPAPNLPSSSSAPRSSPETRPGSSAPATTPPTSPATSGPPAPAGTVARLSGTGSRQSALFNLPGGDAVVRYSSSGGVLTVRLLPKDGGEQRDPFVCNGACDTSGIVPTKAGQHYLDVTFAGEGSWSVNVGA